MKKILILLLLFGGCKKSGKEDSQVPKHKSLTGIIHVNSQNSDYRYALVCDDFHAYGSFDIISGQPKEFYIILTLTDGTTQRAKVGIRPAAGAGWGIYQNIKANEHLSSLRIDE